MDSLRLRARRASRATSDVEVKRSSTQAAPRLRKKKVVRRSSKWARQDDDDLLTDTDDDDTPAPPPPPPAPAPAPAPAIPQRPTSPLNPAAQEWIEWIAANPQDAEWLEFQQNQLEAQQPTTSATPPAEAVETPVETPNAEPSSEAPQSTGGAAVIPTPSPQPQPGPSNSALPEPRPPPDGIGPGGMAAAVVIPLLSVAFLGALVYIIMKRRQRRRQVIVAQEKRMTNSPNGYSGIPRTFQHSGNSEEANIPPPNLPPPALDTSYNPTRVPSRVPSQPPPPFQALYPNSHPVIVGPMDTSNGGAYMTGLDTADVLSVAEPSVPQENQQFLAAKVTPAPEDPDEPPPPYRPRSIANLISRETSRRTRPGSLRGSGSYRGSRGMSGVEESLIVQDGGRPGRNDLDDADDSVSVMSQPLGRNRFRLENDGFSEVSDLSYQSSIRHPR